MESHDVQHYDIAASSETGEDIRMKRMRDNLKLRVCSTNTPYMELRGSSPLSAMFAVVRGARAICRMLVPCAWFLEKQNPELSWDLRVGRAGRAFQNIRADTKPTELAGWPISASLS